MSACGASSRSSATAASSPTSAPRAATTSARRAGNCAKRAKDDVRAPGTSSPKTRTSYLPIVETDANRLVVDLDRSAVVVDFSLAFAADLDRGEQAEQREQHDRLHFQLP